MIKDRDDVEDEIVAIINDFSLLGVLGIYTMRESLLSYLKIESNLERKYQDLFTEKDNVILRNDIGKLLRLRTGFLMQIHMILEYSRISLLDTMTDLMECSDYILEPLNMDLYMESDFYSEDDDSLSDMESMLYSTYQYAIFGDVRHKLSTLKLLDEISNIYYNNKEKDIEDDIAIDKKESLENRLFYLTYLKKISTFMNKYGYYKDLGMVYKRLLYSLDNISDKLYIDGNIDRAIDRIGDIEISEDSYIGLHDEMLFMASEIFEVGVNKYTLRKLMMLATFYDITGCEELVYVIEDYKNNDNYSYFSGIIFGEDKNKGYGKRYEL